MKSKVKKWGNSLGVRIPKNMLEEAHLEDGSEIDISVKDGSIVIYARKKKGRVTLKTLLANLEPEHLVRDDEQDALMGREIW